MLKRLSDNIVKHPLIVIISWALVTAVILAVTLGGVLGDTLFDRLKSDAPTVSGEAQTADDLIKANSSGVEFSETIFILTEGIIPTAQNVEVAKDFTDFKDTLKKQNLEINTPYGIPENILKQQPALSNLISKDSNSKFLSLITVTGDNEKDLQANVDKALVETEAFANQVEKDAPDSKVLVGGKTSAVETVIGQVESDMKKGDAISLPLALIVLLFVFGGFLAAGLPLIGAGVSIITSLGTLFAMSYFMKIDTSVLNVLTVIGLGLSIDYGLLMLSRFRDALRTHQNERSSVKTALAETMTTAGRTVLFSGITVAAAMLSLILFEPVLMKSIGIAGTSVVLLAILTSLTLLPALFVLLGNKLIKKSPLQKVPLFGKALKAFGDTPPETGFFTKLVARVQKRPIVFGVASTLLLVIMGASIVNLNISSVASDKIPATSEVGQLFTTLADEFPGVSEGTATVVLKNASHDTIKTYRNEIQNFAGVTTVTTKPDSKLATISFVVPKTDAKKDVIALRDFRNTQGDTDTVFITGETARDLDYVNSLSQTAPYVAIIVMCITGLLLFLMTGSALIPLKAIFLSVLSLGASIGVLTWGFQEGYLSGVLGFDPASISGIDPLILALVLVFGFGLAMDYEMFLISRIKEKHAKGVSTNEAVKTGIQASGRIITSAALMMVLVFVGFAFGEILMVKMMGVALAVAIIIDATLVRVVLLPAIMTIMGDKIWWAPKWMKKIHDKIGVEH